MRVIKNLLFWVSAVCLVIMILAVTIPKIFGVEFRAVVSGSMTPEIPVGSLVVIVPTKSEDIKVGDDITFVTAGDVVVTHRVIEIDREKNEFTTRGIANAQTAIDAPNKYENILGVVRYKVPGLGQIFSWLSGSTGKMFKIIFATVLVAAFILSNILGLWTKDKNGEEKKSTSGGESKKLSGEQLDILLDSFKESDALFSEEEQLDYSVLDNASSEDSENKNENEEGI